MWKKLIFNLFRSEIKELVKKNIHTILIQLEEGQLISVVIGDEIETDIVDVIDHIIDEI